MNDVSRISKITIVLSEDSDLKMLHPVPVNNENIYYVSNENDKFWTLMTPDGVKHLPKDPIVLQAAIKEKAH